MPLFIARITSYHGFWAFWFLSSIFNNFQDQSKASPFPLFSLKNSKTVLPAEQHSKLSLHRTPVLDLWPIYYGGSALFQMLAAAAPQKDILYHWGNGQKTPQLWNGCYKSLNISLVFNTQDGGWYEDVILEWFSIYPSALWAACLSTFSKPRYTPLISPAEVVLHSKWICYKHTTNAG